MIGLTSEADLAEAWGLTHKEMATLRTRRGWPHVKLSRLKIRYTDEQIRFIISTHTIEPDPAVELALRTGQTLRSAQHTIRTRE